MADTKGNGFIQGLYLAGMFVALVAFDRKDFSSEVNVNVENPAPLFQDIDGDGRMDLVYGINVHLWNSDRGEKRLGYTPTYDVCFRKNIGNGEFAAEKCVLRTTWTEPKVQMLYTRDEDSGKDIFGRTSTISR